MQHQPVLLMEVLEAFNGLHLTHFIDGTLGAGGHAEAILKAHPELVSYQGIDQDLDAIAIATERLKLWQGKLHVTHANFAEFDQVLKKERISKVEGILVDLGVSSMQLDRPERGFSFSKEGPLDMRMNSEGELTAADIVNTWSEKEIGIVFRDYGEEKRWRIAARAIVEARKQKAILTTHDLVNVLRPVLPWNPKKGINPLTLIFQGLRIAVNRELEVLQNFLSRAMDALTPGGRLAVISFHSLEDRIVKDAMRLAASDKWETAGLGGGLFRDKTPTVSLMTRKPIIPTDQEIEANPRSRSAKLRIVECLEAP